MEQKNKSYFRDVAGVSFTFSAGGQLVFTGTTTQTIQDLPISMISFFLKQLFAKVGCILFGLC